MLAISIDGNHIIATLLFDVPRCGEDSLTLSKIYFMFQQDHVKTMQQGCDISICTAVINNHDMRKDCPALR